MKFGEKIYWCKKKATPIGIEEFDSPVEFILRPKYLSLQPTTGYTATQTLGKEISNYQTLICQPYDLWYGRFSEGDLFYADGQVPSDDVEYYGEGANYIVDKVFNQNIGIRVALKRFN